MAESTLARTPIWRSAECSADRAYYDRDVAAEDVPSFLEEVRLYFDHWSKDCARWYAKRDDVRVLELGAGSCALSLLLSREAWTGSIVAGDISTARMEHLRPLAQGVCDGDPGKIQFAEIDFNEPLPFGDGYFDLVMMDGALHHSRAIWSTLAEIRRVLKPQGHFVAQREQYVAPLTARIKMRRLLATDEVRNGVSENAYLKEQYDFYLRASGFDVRFVPVLPSPLFKALRFLNGLAFAKYVILATKAAA